MHNKTIIAFARAEIKRGLLKCTMSELALFLRMFPYTKGITAEDKVDNIPTDKLDRLLTQVEATIKGR